MTRHQTLELLTRLGLALWLMAGVMACDAPPAESSQADEAPSVTPDASKPSPTPVDASRTTARGARATRIVSFVPGMTEVAFDMGLGPRVVGVGTFATHPPEVTSLPRVGGMMDPDLEKTLILKPDLILAAPSVRGLEEFAKTRQIPIVMSTTDTLAHVLDAYDALGEAAGVVTQARAARARLEARLDTLRAPSQGERPSVLLIVGRDPGALTGLYAAGPGSFIDELLTIAGGRNALPASVGKWPKVSAEAVLEQAPDLIIELSSNPQVASPDKLAQARQAWRSLKTLQAAQRGHIYALGGDHILLPGPRLVLTVEALKGVLKAHAEAGDAAP